MNANKALVLAAGLATGILAAGPVAAQQGGSISGSNASNGSNGSSPASNAPRAVFNPASNPYHWGANAGPHLNWTSVPGAPQNSFPVFPGRWGSVQKTYGYGYNAQNCSTNSPNGLTNFACGQAGANIGYGHVNYPNPGNYAFTPPNRGQPNPGYGYSPNTYRYSSYGHGYSAHGNSGTGSSGPGFPNGSGTSNGYGPSPYFPNWPHGPNANIVRYGTSVYGGYHGQNGGYRAQGGPGWNPGPGVNWSGPYYGQ